jgi:hypothetical protein
MTPAEAAELTPDEYRVFLAYRNRDIRQQNRAARRRR